MSEQAQEGAFRRSDLYQLLGIGSFFLITAVVGVGILTRTNGPNSFFIAPVVGLLAGFLISMSFFGLAEERRRREVNEE